MSNYCTSCKWLTKATNGGKTDWYCTCKAKPNSLIPPLTSLCGNPRRAIICEEQNWYESKNKSEVNKLVTEHGRAMQFMVDKMLEQQEKKMTTEEQIKVMQAYIDGKEIEYLSDYGNGWLPANRPNWNWNTSKYRIKPEPKYRPLKPEELIELKGRWIQEIASRCLFQVISIDPRDNTVQIASRFVDAKYLFEKFAYEDGTPVGRLEELKQVSVNQFKETVIASVEHFANSVKPDTEEEVELQAFENWWEEFKQYMEEM